MTLPTIAVEFSPGTGPFDTPAWVAVTTKALALETSDGKQSDLSEFPPGEATIELINDDRLFDPEHAAGTYFGDLLPRVPFRITVFGSLLFYGFVEDGWEQFYDPPAMSTCRVKLVDMLGVLAGYTLPSVYEVEALADSPVALWALDETSGTVMVDRSDNGYDGVYQPGVTATSGDVGLHTGLVLDGDGYGYVDEQAIGAVGGGVVEAIIDLSGLELAGGETFIILESGGGDGRGNYGGVQFGIETTSPTAARLFFRRSGTVAWAGFGYSASFDPTTVHHVAARGRAVSSPDTEFFIDGVAADGASSPPLLNGVLRDTYVGHSKLTGVDFEGGLAWVGVFPYSMSDARIAVHASAALTPLEGQRTDQQVAWALDTVGVPATMYDLDVGVQIMGLADTAGQNALEFIRAVAATEYGSVFVGHHDGGKIRFRNRYSSFQATRSTVTQAAFSDDPAASDVNVYRVDPDRLQIEPNGISTVINQASVTWAGGTEVVDQSAGSPYGPRPVSIDTAATSPLVARSLGQWVLALNGEPKARIRSLGVNPGENAAEWNAYTIRVGDRITYRSHPQEAGSATTKNLEVLGRHHVMQGMEWTVDFFATAAPADGITLFTLGTSTLGGSHVLAF